MQNTPVLILCGGFGTRLQKVVSDVPKPMAPIAGHPFLKYQIEYLLDQGFKKFIFLTGYKSEVIENYFNHLKTNECEFFFSKEVEPLGTGGAIKNAFKRFKEESFLLLNGDSFLAIDYQHFIHRSENANSSIALRYEKSTLRYGQVKIDQNEFVTEFVEKNPNYSGEGFINSGVYFLKKEIFDMVTEAKFSLEKDLFEKLNSKKMLKGIVCAGPFIDIGIPESYESAQILIPKWSKEKKRPALFLDRDGVLIKHVHYLHKIQEVEIIKPITQMIKLAQSHNWTVHVITNQSGVGQGLFTIEECETVHQFIEEQLKKDNLKVHSWNSCYYSPNKGIAEWKNESLRRKPNPGMVLEVCDDFPIDLSNSIFVGDNSTDQLDFINLQTWLIQGDFDLSNRRPSTKYFENHELAFEAFKKFLT